MDNQMFLQYPDWLRAIAALGAVVAVAYVAAELAGRAVRVALMGVLHAEESVSFFTPIVRRPIRVVRAAVFLLVLAVLAMPALEVAGVRTAVGITPAALGVWFFASGLRITIIGIITYVLVRFIAATTLRLEEEIGRAESPDVIDRVKRARTLSRLMRNALTTTVVAIAALMALRELQVDIMPVLTGAGIAGLAVGFGAQTLVKDLIGGVFLTIENQVRVGDVAKINGTGGLVEAINLRTIVLRDLEGIVHVFPNGSIDTLANLSKDFSYYVVDLGVAYKEDPDRVMAVLRDVGSELAADPRFGASILEPLEILGVDAFEESQVAIKVRFKTRPLKQWEVGRELRRRIKKTFDAQGIEFPFPHRSLYFGEASRPFQIEQLGGVQALP